MTRPKVAITMGDPAGVGPEIAIKAVNAPRVREACVPVIVGNAQLLHTLAGRLGLPFKADSAHPDDLAEGFDPEGPTVVDLQTVVIDDIIPGKMSPTCGHAAYDYVRFAIDRTMTGDFDAIATAPISKEAVNAAGIRFPGHTEMLESQTGARDVVMMLYSEQVAVSLVSAHLPLSRVPRTITASRVERVIRLTHANMSLIRGRSPRIAVLGLNPHAGEGGLFGSEEMKDIGPAVESARRSGIQIDGPIPADTAFTPRMLDRYDAHVAMYHDQGLAPFKALSFENGVNITLGIPIIRTSVDHGTAFDIAWKGTASPGSLITAVLLAAKLASNDDL